MKKWMKRLCVYILVFVLGMYPTVTYALPSGEMPDEEAEEEQECGFLQEYLDAVTDPYWRYGYSLTIYINSPYIRYEWLSEEEFMRDPNVRVHVDLECIPRSLVDENLRQLNPEILTPRQCGCLQASVLSFPRWYFEIRDTVHDEVILEVYSGIYCALHSSGVRINGEWFVETDEVVRMELDLIWDFLPDYVQQWYEFYFE